MLIVYQKTTALSAADNAVSAIDKRTDAVTQEGTLKFHLPFRKKGATMELTADYFNRSSHEHADYVLDKEIAGITRDKNRLNLWKFKADFLFRHRLP